ncbi:MAG: SPOR domain-containing protein, partial [Pseudomonadota bacterium]
PAPAKKTPQPQALEATGEGFDFYRMLRDNEVVVTDAFQGPKPEAQRQAVENPGVYTIQAGSFRQLEDAERLQALLALKNMQPRIEAVRIDEHFYHRVRIGPVTDLERLNRYLADLDAEGYKFILLKDDER